MSLEAGAFVGGKIRLIRPLKRGGMGSVWLAEHQTLRMQVAVKFMSEQLAQDQEYVERFSREAMASAQIKSPHVVQVFDTGIAEGTPYIVMELLEGEDLRTRLARTGPISISEAATIVIQVGRALSKAHAAGIVHRDIKPDNIFIIDHEGELLIKILDFGVAKHAAQDTEFGMTGTGAMVGTPHYMSPEQILSSRRVDHRADLWSVGVVVYRVLTGSVPFTGETLGAVCVAIERGQFIPASQRRADLLPMLDAWFFRALARDPAQRFQSAREMAEAFVAAVEAGGYPLSALYRPDLSSQGGNTGPRSLAGFSAPPPALVPSNPWGTNPTNPAMPLTSTGNALPLPSFPLAPLPPPPAPEPAQFSSSIAQQAPQMQTFPGASITHVSASGPSRKTLITLLSALLALILMLTLILVILVIRRDPPPPATAASTATAMTPASPLLTTQLPAATPPSVSSASNDLAPASADTAKTAPVVKTNPTVKPRRDRGF